jgi:hypothetical protein
LLRRTLWRTKAAPPATTVAYFEPESAREQGLAKLGIDGRGREDFDFIIQLLAETLGGGRIKGKSDDDVSGTAAGLLPRGCQWLGSASTG